MARFQHSKVLLYFLLSFSVVYTSCETEDEGDIGAQGPQGPSGENGTIEIYSKIFTITPNDWYTYNTSANSNDSAVIPIPEITQAILDSGMIVCYKLESTMYKSMPFSSYNGLAVKTFQYYFYLGNLVVTCNSNFVGGNNLGNETFKAVVANGHLRKMPEEIKEDEFNLYFKTK
ncbi:MAG: hypothetical protein IPP71_06995 [Bacteroidetes bacterium]|nr:hypothetical protein [Bacteroidota bacterium]